jgi:hypothetical protein
MRVFDHWFRWPPLWIFFGMSKPMHPNWIIFCRPATLGPLTTSGQQAFADGSRRVIFLYAFSFFFFFHNKGQDTGDDLIPYREDANLLPRKKENDDELGTSFRLWMLPPSLSGSAVRTDLPLLRFASGCELFLHA